MDRIDFRNGKKIKKYLIIKYIMGARLANTKRRVYYKGAKSETENNKVTVIN